MSVIIVPAHLLGNPLYKILQVVSLSCPDHISCMVFFCKGHGLPQLVMNRKHVPKGVEFRYS